MTYAPSVAYGAQHICVYNPRYSDSSLVALCYLCVTNCAAAARIHWARVAAVTAGAVQPREAERSGSPQRQAKTTACGPATHRRTRCWSGSGQGALAGIGAGQGVPFAAPSRAADAAPSRRHFLRTAQAPRCRSCSRKGGWPREPPRAHRGRGGVLARRGAAVPIPGLVPAASARFGAALLQLRSPVPSVAARPPPRCARGGKPSLPARPRHRTAAP